MDRGLSKDLLNADAPLRVNIIKNRKRMDKKLLRAALKIEIVESDAHRFLSNPYG